MAADHERYIKNALSKYKYSDMAKRDVLNIFQTFNDLRPKLDSHVFNDGSQKDLLCLEGTIPVNYHGATYNIPLCLWVLDTHPYNPPLVYIRPTVTMRIKQNQHVDANGKVDIPYLREWKNPNSDLFGLLNVLSIVFGDQPPVYSTSAPPPRPGYHPGQSPPSQPQPQQPPAPYPTGGQQSFMPMPGGGSTNAPYPPAYPPSTGGGYPPQPSPQHQQQQTSSYPPYPQSGSGYPPVPPPAQNYPQQQQPGPGYPPAYPCICRCHNCTKWH